MIAQNAQQRQDPWTMRESVLRTITEAEVVTIFDIALSLKHLPAFLEQVRETTEALGGRSPVLGHLGNLHYAVPGLQGEARDAFPIEGMRAAVLDDVMRLHGTFSAEHGMTRARSTRCDSSRTRVNSRPCSGSRHENREGVRE